MEGECPTLKYIYLFFSIMNGKVNPSKTNGPITYIPVNWFTLQINWMVSIWWEHFLLMDKPKTFTRKHKFQGCSEGTSSVAFEVLRINCKIDFINLFIFNCLTLNINLLIFNCSTSNFCFPKTISFASRRERKHKKK